MASFTLGTSTLSQDGPVYVEAPFPERGTSLEVEWIQSGANRDIRLHGWAIRYVPGEVLNLEWPPQRATRSAGTPYGSGAYGAGPYGGIQPGYGTFLLNYSTLGISGVSRVTAPISERGRSIQIEIDQPGGNQDMRVHGWALQYVPAEPNAMEPS